MVLDGTITFSDATLQQSASNTYATGTGQTWTNVTASRATATTYTNSTSKPIFVNIYTNGNGSPSSILQINVAGVFVSGVNNNAPYPIFVSVGALVQPGQTYSCTVSGNGGVGTWMELR